MKRLTIACILMFLLRQDVIAQATGISPNNSGGTGAVSQLTNAVFDYLTMAGTAKSADFKPLSQQERNRNYLKSLINPVLYVKGAMSGAIDLKNDKPEEWEQGASGYAKRTGNILAQYGIQRTVTFGLSSLLHEDNRYFGSGKKGFWRRTGYALGGSFLARQENGKRYPSVSLIGGFAASSFISRSWQPASTRSMGDGAVSFGYCMGYNALTTVLKEFLPDMVRPLLKKRKPPTP